MKAKIEEKVTLGEGVTVLYESHALTVKGPKGELRKLFSVPGIGEQTGIRFATLMRILTQENGGTFVGLNTILP